MGLDMYAYEVSGDTKTEIMYWRKHNALHGWMESLWSTKPDFDPNEPFNG